MILTYEQCEMVDRVVKLIHPNLGVKQDFVTDTVQINLIAHYGPSWAVLDSIPCPDLGFTLDSKIIAEKLISRIYCLLERHGMQPTEQFQKILDKRAKQTITCDIIDI